ncbi:hypothetical protein BESB_020100 [Besnoitia besnoiti]|uniref:Uncharacterized protein n=1 Tax=Besnoitia besnoiti TaxID=94643 RepID=A0A2A9M278_BESBE|nr:hypothetical protein BESB_020100 [Besnoitia besnoiti]PFH32069.1 hypothetical protein BESB_020100 [Besnoitia besnoiti]
MEEAAPVPLPGLARGGVPLAAAKGRETPGPSLLLSTASRSASHGRSQCGATEMHPGRIYNVKTLREHAFDMAGPADSTGKLGKKAEYQAAFAPLSEEVLQERRAWMDSGLYKHCRNEQRPSHRERSSVSSNASRLSHLTTWGSRPRRSSEAEESGPEDDEDLVIRYFGPGDADAFRQCRLGRRVGEPTQWRDACSRAANWFLYPPRDTALHPPPGARPRWEDLDAAEAKLNGPKNRNYHLYARKDKGVAGPGPGVDDEDESLSQNSLLLGLGSTTSTLVLNTQTHRLEREFRRKTSSRRARERLGVQWAADLEAADDAHAPRDREDEDIGELLSDERALKRIAQLMEAFERSGPNSAGWLFTEDFRWALRRDVRIQEIFGLERKTSDEKRKGRRSKGNQAEDGAAQGPLDAIVSWLADTVFRNRDECVTLTKKSRIKLAAMLDELRKVESDLITNERETSAPKMSFDIFSEAFWAFVGKSLDPRVWKRDVGGILRSVAAQKDSPYALTATEMLVRDSILGVNITSNELRLPDYVELGRLGMMEKPDLSLAHEAGVRRCLEEKTQRLAKLRLQEAASPFEESFAGAVRLEKDLAEYQVLKQQLDTVSREAFLSASAESLGRFFSVLREKTNRLQGVDAAAREAGLLRSIPSFQLPPAEYAALEAHHRRLRDLQGEESSSTRPESSVLPTALVSDIDDDDDAACLKAAKKKAAKAPAVRRVPSNVDVESSVLQASILSNGSLPSKAAKTAGAKATGANAVQALFAAQRAKFEEGARGSEEELSGGAVDTATDDDIASLAASDREEA